MVQIAGASEGIGRKKPFTVYRNSTPISCGARALVANPGCYPTSVILGLRPLVESGWIARERRHCLRLQIRRHGRGQRTETRAALCRGGRESARLRIVLAPAHSGMTDHTGIRDENIVFTTHLLPVARGILSTLYVWFAEPHTPADVEALYRKFYAGRPMMRIWPAGDATRTAACGAHEFLRYRIFALDPAGRRLAVVSCLDNLGRAPRARRYRI